MTDFIDSLLKAAGNDLADIVENGVIAGDVDKYIDTGCYIFNALLSGSIYGGLPSNKIFALAGEQHTGKTFFGLSIGKSFLASDPKAVMIIFESESSLSKQMIVERGLDAKRVIIVPVVTVQEFKTQALKIIEAYLAKPEKDRQPLLMMLDSFGMLSTSKEMEDTASGADTRDMTRAQLGKGAFRVLTLKCGLAKIPFIVTNHIYKEMNSMYPKSEMSGGSGLKYAASNIVFLSTRKEKDKDTNQVIGNVIHCKLNKGRFTKTDKMVDVLLNYETGLDRYYGLAQLALDHGIFKKDSTRIVVHDGKKVFMKNIIEDPETYFTDEVLQLLDVAAKAEFCYGQPGIEPVEE